MVTAAMESMRPIPTTGIRNHDAYENLRFAAASKLGMREGGSGLHAFDTKCCIGFLRNPARGYTCRLVRVPGDYGWPHDRFNNDCPSTTQPFESADYMMRPLMIAACLALTTAVAFADEPNQAPAATTTAATPAPAAVPTLKGDAKAGRQLIYTCQGCHGVTGYKNAYPSYHVPRLGGQSEVYLLNALTEYKKGTRKHPTMQAQAQSFSDQDIANIAAYLATVK
jgi:cytochrome c553